MRSKIQFLILFIFLAVANTVAQVPEGFNYQGVLRNSSGELIKNTEVSLRISVIQGSLTGDDVYTETHVVTTNNYGGFALQVGDGSSTYGTFSTIDWSAGPYYMETELDENGESTYTSMGSVPLLSVPYAMYANDVANKDDADADPQNELQDLNLVGDTLKIDRANHIVLPYDTSLWRINNSNLYYNTGNVGVGSTNPASKLEVRSDAVSGALFQVINSNNDTVFAVYPDGVKVFVNPDAKGKVGGFAISGRSPNKAGSIDYMKVTQDSTRIYVNNTTKGKVGGFAISGRSPNKGLTQDYFLINEDSTRFYVKDTTLAKGKVGGFAISGRSPNKAAEKPFLNMNRYNYFIGHEGGRKISTGIYNSTIGYQSGYSIADGNSNAFMGYQSGYGTISGEGNLFIGYQTGYSNQSGDYNTFLGYQAGFSNTNGLFNTYIGSGSGFSNQSGDNNTFVGDSTGFNNTGNSNSFFGTKTGLNNSTGKENVFIGNMCGYNNTSGFSNVYIGNKSGYKSNATSNVLIGHEAGYSSTGGSNVIIGSRAARNATSGNSNVIIGRESALNLGTGYSNVFIGEFSGQENGDGFYNVYVGKGSGQYSDGAGWNVGIGTNAGQYNNGLTNIFIGTEAGKNNTIGSGNIIIGPKAGENNNGYRNVFIGDKAGQNETGSKKLFIEASNADSSMALIYGDFDTDWVRINDAFGVGRNPEVNNLEVEGNASKSSAGDWLANSDKRIKTDIQDLENSFEILLKLRPVKFKYTEEWKEKHPTIEDKYYYNFIAQEYQQVFPESVQGSGEYIEGDEDEILQIDTYNAQILTIKAVQELIIENKEVRIELLKLKEENEMLKKKIDEIMSLITK